MAQSPDSGSIVYFDGACPICSREIAFYKDRARDESLTWIDVSDDGGASPASDLSKEQAMSALHVRRSNGTLIKGERAFVEIWTHIPSMRWMAGFFNNRVGLFVLKIAYRLFLLARPLMPRRARSKPITS